MIDTILNALFIDNDVEKYVTEDFIVNGNLVEGNVYDLKRNFENNLDSCRFFVTNQIKKTDIISSYVTLLGGKYNNKDFYPVLIGMKVLIHITNEKVSELMINIDYAKENTEFFVNANFENTKQIPYNFNMIPMTNLETVYIFLAALDYGNYDYAQSLTTLDIHEIIALKEEDNSNMFALRIENEDENSISGYRLQLNRIKSKSFNSFTKNKIYYNSVFSFTLKDKKIMDIKVDKKIIENEIDEDEVIYHE